MKKPSWFVKKWRRWVLRQCPYCKAKLQHGTIGLFLDAYYGCPNGHYGEESVLCAGIIIYDRGGESILPPRTPDLKVVGKD